MSDGLLVGAGPCDPAVLKHIYLQGNWDWVIAVDGGYLTLQQAQIHPTYLIGDLDSLGFSPDDVFVERYSPIKDASDMELAFEFLKGQSLDTVFVLGALGGRLDHTLANLAVFARASETGMRVTAIDKNQVVALLTGPGSFSLPKAEKGVVSVMALSDVVEAVSESGLYYPLDNANLTNRTTLGLSNELQGKPVAITVQKGTLAIFYPLELLLNNEHS